ncbi:MAG: ADP-ribosylglycohydrolase family protein [Armatimonadota bacterium]
MPDTRSQYRGCMLGLAIGDALGAPAECLGYDAIRQRYGPGGITDFVSWGGFPAGSFTDDTQMALATAEGCIAALRSQQAGGADPVHQVYQAYLAWLKSQQVPSERRGPGHTCLSALGSGKMGTIVAPINNSKGCGGIMRAAPAGLAFAPREAFKMAAAFAAITHGHPSGYLSAGFLAEVVANVVADAPLADAIDAAIHQLVRYEHHKETLLAVGSALDCASLDEPAAAVVPRLGEGWVGEEALAIALYCSLRHPDSYADAVLAAVNHSGDSDSTGAVCGAVMGALLGDEAIPSRWRRTVEKAERILQVSEELYVLSRGQPT